MLWILWGMQGEPKITWESKSSGRGKKVWISLSHVNLKGNDQLSVATAYQLGAVFLSFPQIESPTSAGNLL